MKLRITGTLNKSGIAHEIDIKGIKDSDVEEMSDILAREWLKRQYGDKYSAIINVVVELLKEEESDE